MYRLALVLAALAEIAAAVWIFRRKAENTPQTDRIPRAKIPGIVLGFLALLWCVPHARPIVFDWMLPMLYPMVIGLTILSWFFLDYLFSRALGGLMILCAYYFVHGAWEFHTPGTAGLSILYWLLGIAGIAFSGKPCWMRDFLRSCCRSPKIRTAAGISLAVLSAVTLLAAVLTAGGVQ